MTNINQNLKEELESYKNALEFIVLNALFQNAWYC